MFITTEKEAKSKAYPLYTMLIGLISFIISGIIAGFISLRTNEGLILILGVPAGSLLMLFILRKLSKDKLLSVIIRSELGGLTGVFAGFLIGELLAWIIGILIPSLNNLEQIKAQIVPNIIILIIADAVFGTYLSYLYYGRKSNRFFAMVCGLASIPFGLMLNLPIKISWINFDLNMLIILTSFGTATGLSIGLYSLFKLKEE